MNTKQEQVSYLVGWLDGFASTVWALVSTEDGAKLVDASAGEEYDQHVRSLRELLYGCPTTNAPKGGEDE